MHTHSGPQNPQEAAAGSHYRSGPDWRRPPDKKRAGSKSSGAPSIFFGWVGLGLILADLTFGPDAAARGLKVGLLRERGEAPPWFFRIIGLSDNHPLTVVRGGSADEAGHPHLSNVGGPAIAVVLLVGGCVLDALHGSTIVSRWVRNGPSPTDESSAVLLHALKSHCQDKVRSLQWCAARKGN